MIEDGHIILEGIPNVLIQGVGDAYYRAMKEPEKYLSCLEGYHRAAEILGYCFLSGEIDEERKEALLDLTDNGVSIFPRFSRGREMWEIPGLTIQSRLFLDQVFPGILSRVLAEVGRKPVIFACLRSGLLDAAIVKAGIERLTGEGGKIPLGFMRPLYDERRPHLFPKDQEMGQKAAMAGTAVLIVDNFANTGRTLREAFKKPVLGNNVWGLITYSNGLINRAIFPVGREVFLDPSDVGLYAKCRLPNSFD